MRGADALLRTLVGNDVDVCFANPGTSEMHFVAALDAVPEMRGVLGLFEGVVTGAADGYGRMTGRPAATLLHLGPGLGNGLANLHNARRARTPIVNVVGDHALDHKVLDAPLESDIDAVAGSVSRWVRRSTSVSSLPGDAVDAVVASRTGGGGSATLILPADVAWTDGAEPAGPGAVPAPSPVDDDTVRSTADVLRSAGASAAVFVGGPVMDPDGMAALQAIHEATGARVLHETFPSRMTRGAGRFESDRLMYLAEMAADQLAGVEHLVLVGTVEPVAFFAYPDKPGRLVPAGCTVHAFASPGDDCGGALAELAGRVAGRIEPTPATVGPLDRPTGAIDVFTAAAAVAATLPEGAIVSDESATCGLFMQGATLHAPEHDWLSLTGGAIGQGMPVATGAAIACRDRPVLSIQADGSAMYTIQALWTQAREQLDVTTVICNNGAYAVLAMEMDRVGGEFGGPISRSMFDLTRPDIDFCRLAEGQGVPATRATDAEALTDALERAQREPGPHVIEAMFRP
ncbi:MAG: acetolactate synthase large subunit [Acidimicrobiales bacterium]|nr:acetolactate synthase large subunit [Acidimicrobiales bacterium]